MSITNITEPNHDQKDHHIKLVIAYQNQVPWSNASKGGKMPKTEKGS